MSGSWLDALLGRVLNNGTEVVLAGGLNFKTGLQAVYNSATKVIDIALTNPLALLGDLSVVGSITAGTGMVTTTGTVAGPTLRSTGVTGGYFESDSRVKALVLRALDQTVKILHPPYAAPGLENPPNNAMCSSIAGFAQTTDGSTWVTVASIPEPNDSRLVVARATGFASPTGLYREIKCGCTASAMYSTVYYGGDGSAANIRLTFGSGLINLQVVGPGATTVSWLGLIDVVGQYLD